MVYFRTGCNTCGVSEVVSFETCHNVALYRGLFTGVYVSNSSMACQHVLKSSHANIVVVDDLLQMQKILEIKHELPDLRAIVQISGPFVESLTSEDGFWRWDELLTMNTDDVEIEYEQRLADISAGECCALLYTSGTTGDPKGVMISHDNFTWTVEKVAKRLEISEESQEVFMSYLPLSHMAGQLLDVFLSLSVAATVYFAEKDAMKLSFMQTLNEVRPTLFMGVPRIYEKLQNKIKEIENCATTEETRKTKKIAMGLDRC